MSALVLAHASRQLPESLAALPQIHRLSSFADRKALDQALRGAKTARRLIVLPAEGSGADADLAAVLTRLMRREQLELPVAYLPAERTPCAKAHALSLDPDRALAEAAVPRPLLRDDDGFAIVGEAAITGPEGGSFYGESIVDDTQLRFGEIGSVVVRATGSAPGLRACARRGGRLGGLAEGILPPKWVEGRAAQTGAAAMRVVRDGVAAPRSRTRITFFRHTEDWLLVP
ncbi:hypothetical protein [Segniliparus rugosus]|uniref:Uncharacterized protein n=1 Tax=Segniliparus rugosus (strain ATCC BAA-974 / DSM 45345 / CCUG 50838 / CIP 108380 / JCM 13579 / CDC 945) TaxID=679197 RepID=E5XPH4_SEGRC|nr:hypothetical protein [Segniliparus rugosus]EFV13757.2 hypothetical protein HMPREF9336_01396 [Segniliparus rugosus ATCC BAA-974]